MPDPYVMRRMIAEEQAEFGEMLRGLTEQQWEAPTLCTNWSVHELVIHIAIHTHGTDVARQITAARRGFTIDRVHAPERARKKEELIDWLESPAVDASTFNLKTQLSELIIHQQDVRRPLGIPRTIPEERLAPVLDNAVTNLGSLAVVQTLKKTKGLRLVATDIDWSVGAGPEVRGPGEAIFMALAGRAPALDDLEGEGTAKLRMRL